MSSMREARKGKTPPEVYRDHARRQAGKSLAPADVHEIVSAVITELVQQGMNREHAAGLVVRLAQQAARE